MPSVSGFTKALKHLFDGSEWVAARGVLEHVSHVSASRTATNNGTEFINTDAQNALIIWDITANTGAISVNFHLQIKDPASGKWIDLAGSANRVAIETKAMARVPANITVTGDIVVLAEVPIGRTMRVQVIHNNANPVTYSVGVVLT